LLIALSGIRAPRWLCHGLANRVGFAGLGLYQHQNTAGQSPTILIGGAILHQPS
jgi:hypothetical protein